MKNCPNMRIKREEHDMQKSTNLPIDKKRFKEILDRMGLRQADVDRILGLKRLSITKAMHYGNVNPRVIDALEKQLGIMYDDVCPRTDTIEMLGSNGTKLMSVKEDIGTVVKTEISKPEQKPIVSVNLDADVLAEAVKEGMKQFWQECGNDILKELEDAIFTGNYDARRKYTSQDLTYDLHKCWNTDKGYADLPEVQATLRRKR